MHLMFHLFVSVHVVSRTDGQQTNNQKQVELKVREEEKEPLLDMLQCLYTDTLRASTFPDLLRVLFVADKVILRSLTTLKQSYRYYL